MVNPRKEFFQVSLGEIEAFVMNRGLKIELTKLAEAREFRETLALRQQSVVQSEQAAVQFPSTLFGGTIPSHASSQ